MEISLYSFFMAFICATSLSLLIYIYRKKYMLTYQIEVWGLFSLQMLCIIRILTPIDFFFTQSIQ